jgi:hypothetical protein
MFERGGVLIRVDGSECAPNEGSVVFIPAEVVVRLTILSALTPVVGMHAPAAGIALADDGEVVTVLRIGGAERDAFAACRAEGRRGEIATQQSPLAVLCRVKDHEVAVIGAAVIATGRFAGDGEGVLWEGTRVPVVDVQALTAQAEAASWACGAPSSAPAPRVGGAA